jgi:acetyltransferase-like isoleucine patch superfamily enzyme
MPGVSIGRNAVIGANSVVIKSVPDHCVAAGAPAKVIRKYDPATNQWSKVSSSGK